MTTKAIIDNSAANISVEYFSDNAIAGFIASRHAAPTTAKTYRSRIRQMLKYFAAQGISEPATADLDNFINKLREDGKSDATLRLTNTVMRKFFGYLFKHGIYRDVAADCEPLRLDKSTTHNRESLSDAQAKKLLASVKGEDIISKRDRAIVSLALCTGLRTCEISRANIENFIDCGDYYQLNVRGKRRQKADEKVKVALPVATLINEYLNLRGGVEDNSPLFASTSNNNSKYGNRLSEQSVGKMIARRMKLAGIKTKNNSAHSTRHYAAETALNCGVDIRDVKSMLRHRSLNTTLIYIEDLAVKKRRAELAVAASLFGGALKE